MNKKAIENYVLAVILVFTLIGLSMTLIMVGNQSPTGLVSYEPQEIELPPCGDCDDNDPNNFPGNTEDCMDGQDNDCDGDVDCEDSDCFQDSFCLSCGNGEANEGEQCDPINRAEE